MSKVIYIVIPKPNEKIEILARRRPEFEPGIAGAEAAQLEKVERCRRVQSQRLSDVVKSLFFIRFWYILVLLFAFAESQALDYPRAIRRWPQVIPTEKNQTDAMKEFYESVGAKLSKQGSQNFEKFLGKELPEGSCYGQCYGFMLQNSPKNPQLKLPKTTDDQKLITWFQAKLGAMVFFNKKYQALLDRGLQTVREGYPNTYCPDGMAEEKIVELLKALSLKKNFKEKCFNLQKEYNTVRAGIDFLDELERKEQALLAEKGLRMITQTVTRINAENSTSYKQAFPKRLEQIYAAKSSTDLVIGFDFYHNGMRSGHAILVQLKYLRVYDAMRGIFQYKSFEDLQKDLPLSQLQGNNHFQIIEFGPMP